MPSRDSNSVFNTPATIWLPTDPPRPASPVLTAAETCLLLRLPVEEGETESSALERLQRYREKGTLRGVQLGKNVRFKLVDVLSFIDQQQADVRR
jgi:hypothetical protein